jgi:DNA-binding CsgD family transcriptional regulator
VETGAQELTRFGKRALVIAGDRGVADSVKEGLCRAGVDVHVVCSPAAARSLLDAHKGDAQAFELVCMDATFLAGDGGDLLGEVGRTATPPKLALLVGSDRSGAPARVVPVTNLPEPGDYEGLLAALALPDASGETAAFCRTHGLSRCESALLSFAVQGLNNDEAAELLGCHRCTVGTYWSRIFRKTRTSGQRDVLGKLLRARYASNPSNR